VCNTLVGQVAIFNVLAIIFIIFMFVVFRYPHLEEQLLQSLEAGCCLPILAAYNKNYYIHYLQQVFSLFPREVSRWALATSNLLKDEHRVGVEDWSAEKVLCLLAYSQVAPFVNEQP